MNLNYTINDKHLSTVKYSNADLADLISNQFQGSFRAALYIFKCFFKITFLDIELISKDVYYTLVKEIVLLVKTKDGLFRLALENDKFKIISDDKELVFSIQNNVLSLVEYTKSLEDRILIERFATNSMEVEIHFKKTGKVFSLQIPITKKFFLNFKRLIILKEDMNIEGLISFYRKNFLKRQNAFDKDYYNTIISIWQKTGDFLDSNSRGIKIDEVSLNNDFIFSYQLGSVNYDQSGNPIIVVLKDGIYTIIGYDSEKKNFLDLNQSVLLLERRKQELN